MLLNTSIRQEMGRNFAAVLFVLLTIVMTIVLIRSLRFATLGVVSPTDTVLFMFFTVIGYSPSILALCLFVAVVSCFSRLYQDSEMVVWSSSGQSLLQMLHPVAWFGIPVVVGVLVFAFWLQPWGNRQVLSLRAQYEVNQLKLLIPGEFQESRDRSRVVFIGKDQDKKAQTSEEPKGKVVEAGSVVHDIFVELKSRDKDIAVFAPSARIESKNGQLYAVLRDGQQLGIGQNQDELRIASYDTYGVWLKKEDLPFDLNKPAGWPARAQPMQTLFEGKTPEQAAALYWRVGLPLLGAVSLLLGLAITNRHPRAGRSLNLMYALLLFVTYYNLMVITQNYVKKGQIGPWMGLLMVHGGAMLLSVGLLLKRQYSFSIRQRLGL